MGRYSCPDPTVNCVDSPRLTPALAAKGVDLAEPMDVGKGKPEHGAAAIISAKTADPIRDVAGAAAGQTDGNAAFSFRFALNPGEKVGVTVHSHGKSNAEGIYRRQRSDLDKRNEYPSSQTLLGPGDLRGTMQQTNAPIIFKTPSGAIREVYRINGVDHMVTLKGAQPEPNSIPEEINENFVVDPEE